MIPSTFALLGAAGYVAPRHMQAIRDTGNQLVAALDPYDNVGALDSYFLDCSFFTLFERFDRFLDKWRRDGNPIQWLSIATPNHLHDAHIRYGLRNGCNVICEKPLVIMPRNLEGITELERETERRVFCVMQLRKHPAIVELKRSVDAKLAIDPTYTFRVNLSYITLRGPWFSQSWKGTEDLSGGLAANIGIHFLDMLIWIFGPELETELYWKDAQNIHGQSWLNHANVGWLLSTSEDGLPDGYLDSGQRAYRSLVVDETEIEFSGGFDNLHTEVYRDALDGRGVGISDARPSIELAHKIRNLKGRRGV